MNFKEIIVAIAIFVLTLFVSMYGVNSLYSEPVYEDFCSNSILYVEDMNESVCFENGGKWNSYPKKVEGESNGWCDQDYSCRSAYDLAKERYSMNLFLISIPLGVLILFLGFYFFNVEAVGLGLMIGGVGTMLRGIGSYWRYSEDWLRFLVSLVALLIVIYFSYRFRDRFGKK